MAEEVARLAEVWLAKTGFAEPGLSFRAGLQGKSKLLQRVSLGAVAKAALLPMVGRVFQFFITRKQIKLSVPFSPQCPSDPPELLYHHVINSMHVTTVSTSPHAASPTAMNR